VILLYIVTSSLNPLDSTCDVLLNKFDCRYSRKVTAAVLSQDICPEDFIRRPSVSDTERVFHSAIVRQAKTVTEYVKLGVREYFTFYRFIISVRVSQNLSLMPEGLRFVP
jgi:hypothetical protein